MGPRAGWGQRLEEKPSASVGDRTPFAQSIAVTYPPHLYKHASVADTVCKNTYIFSEHSITLNGIPKRRFFLVLIAFFVLMLFCLIIHLLL